MGTGPIFCLIVNLALDHVTGHKFIPVGLFILHKHFKAHPFRQHRDGHLAGLLTCQHTGIPTHNNWEQLGEMNKNILE